MIAPFLLCGNEGSAARRVEEMTGPDHDRDLPPLKAPITDAAAARRLREIEDPADRVKVWNGPTARIAGSCRHRGLSRRWRRLKRKAAQLRRFRPHRKGVRGPHSRPRNDDRSLFPHAR